MSNTKDILKPIISPLLKSILNANDVFSSRYFRRNEGATDYISIPPINYTGDFKFSFNLMVDSSAPEQWVYSDWDSGANERSLGIRINGGLFSIFTSVDGSSSVTGPNKNISSLDGLIVAFTVRKSGTSIFLSVNGETEIQGPSASTLFNTGNDVFFMARQGAPVNLAGILSDFNISDSGTIIRSYAIDDNSDTIVDLAGGFDGTVINGLASDWGLFTEQSQGGDWLGVELITQDVWENPNVVKSEWSFANDQWTLTGGGTSNLLQLIATADQPQRVLLVGNLASLVGELSTSASTNLNIVTTTGIYTEIIDTLSNRQLYKRAVGIVNATIDKPSMREILQVTA